MKDVLKGLGAFVCAMTVGYVLVFGLVNVVPWMYGDIAFALSPWLSQTTMATVDTPTSWSPPVDVVPRQGSTTVYFSSDVKRSTKLGECDDSMLEASVGVYTIPAFSDEDVLGQFSTPDGVPRITVKLGNVNIDVVSHEVHHFVDASTGAKGIDDGETAAYMQGYFTQCVWDLLTKTK